MSNQSLNLSNELYQYLLNTSLREDELLESLRNETALDPMSRMQIAPEQGQFMGLLVKLIGATKIIEVGTYTGYSSLCMAKCMPKEGVIICCDVSEQWTTIAKRYWQAAQINNKIDLRLAPAIETLNQLLKNRQERTFDMAFIDADKENYDNYYERCLRLLRPGGLIIIDNTLWGGSVIDHTKQDVDTKAIRALNMKLKNDKRIELSQLPLGDGLTLCLKK